MPLQSSHSLSSKAVWHIVARLSACVSASPTGTPLHDLSLLTFEAGPFSVVGTILCTAGRLAAYLASMH